MYVVTNTNEIITYTTVRQQSSLYVKNRIAAKKRKSRMPGEPEGIRENLSIEAYSARDRSCHDQKS